MKKIIIFMLLQGLLVSCGKSNKSATPKKEITANQVMADKYLQMVNNHRKRLGLSPVAGDPFIEEVSLGHSRTMAQGRKFFGHSGWKKRCAELRNRLKGNLCGEIVARGQKTPEDVFRAWLNSPSHREVIEGDTYTHTGLGFYTDHRGMIYWTQLFLEI